MTSQPPQTLSLLRISGVDASAFLQGQLSNDITLLDGVWQYSAYCNPKGRVLALLMLWQRQDHYYALLNSDLVESTIKRLRMYVMRSKVDIEVLDSARISYSVSEKAELRSVNSNDDGFTLSSPAGTLMIELSANHTDDNQLELWFDSLIEHGMPSVSAATAELFIPQMLNLDILDGINFKKGCYTGQEIVARMHYLGKLKQRMLVCTIDSNSNASAGDKVFTDGALSKSTGNIVAVNSTADQALAVIRLEHADSDLYLENSQQLKIAADQPYPFPANKSESG